MCTCTTEPYIGVFKLDKKAILPDKKTIGSACYDLFACLNDNAKVTYYDNNNLKKQVSPNKESLVIYPNFRYLIPTGCKFQIPDGYSLRIHPRSGNALKDGLIVANCEGIIDDDYFHETFILLVNTSSIPTIIKHGQSLAQIELRKTIEFVFEEIFQDFGQKTNRIGGLGSTGK